MSKPDKPAALTDKAMTSCSAGPLGALKWALLPLWPVEDPATMPMSSLYSLTTTVLSTTSVIAFSVMLVALSPNAMPSAVALNAMDRPVFESVPMACRCGQKYGERLSLMPPTSENKLTVRRPLLCKPSQPKCMATALDASSASMAMLGPLMPMQKEKRLAQIAADPPVAPKEPSSPPAVFSMKLKSELPVPKPKYIPPVEFMICPFL
mmetsp:Transcript_104355/g.319470  ORF Transcript_104355/g.319470 Transcript_104355/m.319470 type:complete len:208 (+) Transcript_104355:1790-2413(+)